MINVPEVFAREIVDREGVEGARWIASLAGLVEELLERWTTPRELAHRPFASPATNSTAGYGPRRNGSLPRRLDRPRR
jgi:hypothetical protein